MSKIPNCLKNTALFGHNDLKSLLELDLLTRHCCVLGKVDLYKSQPFQY